MTPQRLALTLVLGLSPTSTPAGADSPPPYRYSYYLFGIPAPGTGDDAYLPLLMTREPIDQGDGPEAAVLVTYERDGLWKLEPRTEALEPGAVEPKARRVNFRGKPYRYQLVSNAEAVRLLEHPEGAIPPHRREAPVGREAEALRKELLRDLSTDPNAASPTPPGSVAEITAPDETLSRPGSPEAAAGLAAKLEVVDEPSRPWTEAIARVRLTVDNRGEGPCRLLRLRAGWLEHNGGNLHGWHVRIDGPGGEYGFPIYTGLIPALTEGDYIELAPGESVSTILFLEMASCRDGDVRRPLASTPGEFTVSASFPGLKIEPLRFTKK